MKRSTGQQPGHLHADRCYQTAGIRFDFEVDSQTVFVTNRFNFRILIADRESAATDRPAIPHAMGG